MALVQFAHYQPNPKPATLRQDYGNHAAPQIAPVLSSAPTSASTVSSAPAGSSGGGGSSSGFSDMLSQIQQIAEANTAKSIAESRRQAEETRQFNMQEAAKNRDWQEMMSNTAHQREVKDLMAAGLNPVLSAMNGNGAAVGSGAAASSAMPNSADVDKSGSQSIASMFTGMLASQATMAAASTSAAALMGSSQINADASKFSAALSAAASRYGSDKNSGAIKYASSVNALSSLLGSALRIL